MNNMDELIFSGNKYISSKRAGKLTGYTTDYIGQMCRGDKMDCRLVGRNWYVNEEVITAQKKSFKKEQLKEDKRAIEYKKLDLEPMYYTDDSRDNNPEIEKTITKDIEEDDESALEVERVEEEVEKPKEDLIPVLSMVESQAIDLRDNKKQEVIKRPAKQLVKRDRLLPQRSPVRLPMVRIMASVVVLIGLLFVAGTFVLQQTIHYTYSDSVVNTEFQLAGVSGLFDF